MDFHFAFFETWGLGGEVRSTGEDLEFKYTFSELITIC